MEINKRKLMMFIDELKKIFPSCSSSVEPEVVLQNTTKLEELFKATRRKHLERAQSTLEKFRKTDPQNPVFVCGNLGAGNPLRNELAHTKTLAWLFDKKQKHGFGDSLLITLLRTLEFGNKHEKMQLQVNRVVSEKFTASGHRIDIWVDGFWEDPENKRREAWVLVVEAKVDALERDHQLPNYDKEIAKWKKMNPKAIVWKVFLTPDGRKSRASNWLVLSYKDVVNILWKGVCSAVNKANYELPGLPIARCYFSCVLNDIVRMPLPLGNKIGNPYLALNYLEGCEL